MNRRNLIARSSALALLALVKPAQAVCAVRSPRSPEERIAAAVEEIRAALAEKYPSGFVSDRVGCFTSSGSVAVGVHPVEGYEARVHWYDGQPLLPHDAGEWSRP